MRLTLAAVKNSRIPEALNIPTTDTRLVDYVNEATQRLLHKGHWWGSMAKLQLNATAGLITLPPQVATIEKVAVSAVPIPVRDFWYEFMENGWGVRDSLSGTDESLYRGHYPCFADITGVNKKVKVICDLATDVGREVLILGFDENQNWVRTLQGGVMADGEVVLLAQTPGTLSTKLFTAISDIQPPQTSGVSDLDGQWWLYEYDTTLLTSRQIGAYQYWETSPSYPRYLFPTVPTTVAGTTVEALCKLEFIPVHNDTDYLIIGNIAALKLECLSLKAEEEGRYEEAVLLEAKAVAELNNELAHYLGDGRTISMTVQGSSIGALDRVPTYI